MVGRSRVVLITVFLVAITAAVGGATAVGTLSVDDHQAGFIEVENSTNYLAPAEENVTGEAYQTAGVDVAGAIAADTERLTGEKNVQTFEARLEGDIDSRIVARQTIDDLETGIARLDEHQRDLFRQYGEGEITTDALLRELARIEVAASQYRGLAEQVRSEANVPEGSTLGTRYANLNAETTLLPAPLSERVERILSGDAEPAPFYVLSGDDSVVLATVVNNTFRRQATVRGQRDSSLSDQFVLNDSAAPRAAFDRASKLYGWTSSEALSPIRGFGNSSVYLFPATHSHGELQSYIDGGTRNVFHENQQKNPIAVPVSSTTTSTSETMRLNVQSTAPTGPMLVNLVGTGEVAPEEVQVRIDGHPVGTLEVGEELWTVQPLGTFEVTAVAPTNETVTVTGP